MEELRTSLFVKKSKNINLKIVLASSSILKNMSLDEILKKDGFKIDYKFYSHLEGENKYTMTKSSGLIILNYLRFLRL